jgi:hypothetical protein
MWRTAWPQGESWGKNKNMADKKLNALDQIMDPDNKDNVVLFCVGGEDFEFEQIAIIPYCGKVYTILKPVEEFEGIGDDEAPLFSIDEKNGEFFFNEVNDTGIKNAAFEIYTKLWYEEKMNSEIHKHFKYYC